MQHSVDLDVVIPAWNEEKRLPSTLRELTARLAELDVTCRVTVVDNASTDGTADVVRGWPDGSVQVRLLECSTQGKGAAVRHGVLASDARWVGFTDADLAASLDCLSELIAELSDGAQVVVGSRRLQESRLLVQQALVRRLGGYAYRSLVSRLVPSVYDTQCGFKFFDSRVTEVLFEPLVLTGWSFDVEVLARACRHYFDVREIPVDWTHNSDSRFAPVRDGIRSFTDLLVVRKAMAGYVPQNVTSGVSDDSSRDDESESHEVICVVSEPHDPPLHLSRH